MKKFSVVSVVDLEHVHGGQGMALELSVPELEETCRRHAAKPVPGLSPVQSCLAGVAGYGASKALKQLQSPQTPTPRQPGPLLPKAPLEREA
jgi:hypothetical protein